VGFIFEATIRLLDEYEVEQINTNVIARLAGISIGTLYQYFPDKTAVFNALASRELQELADKVRDAVCTPPTRPGARVAAVLDAVLDAYGGREVAHQRLLKYSIAQGGTGLLAPLFNDLGTVFETQALKAPGITVSPLTKVEAFVLVRAVAGVLQASIGRVADGSIERKELDAAVMRLVLNYLVPGARLGAGAT